VAAVTGASAAALVAALAATTCSLRAAGPAVVGSRPLPPRLARLIELVAPALLAALIVWQVFAHDRELVVDARVAGLAAAAAATLARLPIPLVLVASATTTALTRLA
jgi:branched-subunit amino acid transport protein